jgi:hypothetical protein
MRNLANNVMVANSKLAAAIVAGVILASSVPAANAVTYSTTGSATQFSLGDTLGSASNYDILQILPYSGTITGTGPTTITLNKLIFTAGPNATVPANYINNPKFTFTESVTINTKTASGTQGLTVPFNLSINYSDTLTVVGGITKISIPVGSSIWNIVVSALTIGPNAGGPEIGFLTATVSDPSGTTPLPAAFVLFGSGLTAIELLRRRKKSTGLRRPA